MATTPLAVLDLVPISSGSTAAEALRNSIDLAQAAERFGYARYWFAEHHLNPGVAGTSPAVVLALTAAATSTIRIGSGAVQMGHRTALSTVEEFGLIDALHPAASISASAGPARRPPAPAPRGRRSPRARGRGRPRAERAAHPAEVLLEHLLGTPRFAMQKTLLQLPGAQPQDYTEQVNDVLALLRGTYRSADGVEAHAIPGEGADVQVWILGSSGGQSARWPGRTACGSRPTITSARRRCWRPPRGTGPRSGLPPTWTSPTSASPPMSSSPRMRRPPGNSPPATACGSAASARARARSRSPPQRRRERTLERRRP